MDYNWTIPANLTASPDYFRHVLVKESAAILGETAPAMTESLPSTSNGGTFTIFLSMTTSSRTTAASFSFASTTTTAVTTSSSPRSTGDTTQDSTHQTTDAAPSATSLSTGAKVGIGVGVSLGVLLYIGAEILLLWIRRRARRTINATSAETETQTRYDKADLDTGGHGETTQQKQQESLEADSRPLSELMAEPYQPTFSTQRSVELSGNHGL